MAATKTNIEAARERAASPASGRRGDFSARTQKRKLAACVARQCRQRCACTSRAPVKRMEARAPARAIPRTLAGTPERVTAQAAIKAAKYATPRDETGRPAIRPQGPAATSAQ